MEATATASESSETVVRSAGNNLSTGISSIPPENGTFSFSCAVYTAAFALPLPVRAIEKETEMQSFHSLTTLNTSNGKILFWMRTGAL